MDKQILLGLMTGFSIALLVMGLVFTLSKSKPYERAGFVLMLSGLAVWGIKILIWGFW